MGFEVYTHGDVQNVKSKRIVTSAASKDLYLCIETEAKILDDMMMVPELKTLSPCDNSKGLRQKREDRVLRRSLSQAEAALEVDCSFQATRLISRPNHENA